MNKLFPCTCGKNYRLDKTNFDERVKSYEDKFKEITHREVFVLMFTHRIPCCGSTMLVLLEHRTHEVVRNILNPNR